GLANDLLAHVGLLAKEIIETARFDTDPHFRFFVGGHAKEKRECCGEREATVVVEALAELSEENAKWKFAIVRARREDRFVEDVLEDEPLEDGQRPRAGRSGDRRLAGFVRKRWHRAARRIPEPPSELRAQDVGLDIGNERVEHAGEEIHRERG